MASNVKIHLVDKLFAGSQYRTDLWISDDVTDALDGLQKKDRQRFLKKLEHYAKAGFDQYEFGRGPIRHEWGGVYRIEHAKTLLRVIGFYHDRPGEFIAIDAFWKGGQKLSKPERDRIDKVVKTKQRKLWRKTNEH